MSSANKVKENMMTKSVAAGLLVLLAATVGAQATIVTNGSFEDPAFDAGTGFVYQVPTGWTNAPGATILDGCDPNPIIHHPSVSGLYPAAADGTAVLGLEMQMHIPTSGYLYCTGVSQNLGAMEAGKTYLFSATLTSNSQGLGSFFDISFNNVEDGTTLAGITELDFNPSALGILQSVTATFSYTATAADAGDTLQLIMQTPDDRYTVSGDWGLSRTGVDNVIVTVTPEPATMGLLAIGGVLTLLRRKRA